MIKTEVLLPELPDRYEYTGEFRIPITGEYYLVIDSSGVAKVDICGPKGYYATHIVAIHYRGSLGSEYYYIDTLGKVLYAIDMECAEDNSRYDYGNYFRTESEADRMSMAIRDIQLGVRYGSHRALEEA